MRRWLRDERGATAIEYALIASLVSVAMIAGLNSYSSETVAMYARISNAVSGAIGGPP